MKRLSFLLCLITAQLFAQVEPSRLNEEIRYGKLDNGFTYYILHNEEPKGRASFYLVQNVGAILEDDDQDGLAHMLEHMAFNGSDNFPDKGIKDFLERQGVSFGSNINAYTNLDETVYNISNVPTEKAEVMDSCVLIIHDWSGSLTLSDEEIDAERAVIHEEWRTRNSASSRIYKLLSPTIYYQSKYAKRDVIGNMEVVDHSDYNALKRFYQKWYRPDLQAAVIVGDFDADVMEERVKKILGSIPAPQNPAERIEFSVQPNEELLYKVATDKEATSVGWSLRYKHATTPKSEKNEKYIAEQVNRYIVSMMMGSRFSEILNEPGAAFLSADAAYYNEIRTQDIFEINGSSTESGIEASIEAVVAEVERARRHGFLASELDRTIKNLESFFESRLKTKDEISNDDFAMQLKDHYLVNEPQLSIEEEWSLVKAHLDTVGVAQINEYLDSWMTPDNEVFIITGPQKATMNYPSAQAVKDLLLEVRESTLDPYTEELAADHLIDNLPEPGAVVKQTDWYGYKNAQEYTLSNGARVVLCPTDYANSEIAFSAFSWGGSAALPDDQMITGTFFSGIMDKMGLANFSDTDLRKMLAGKNLSLSMLLAEHSEHLMGGADRDDLETFMQLLYLMFEQPRFDASVFEAYMEQVRPMYQNNEANASSVFYDSLSYLLNNGNPRRPIINEADLDLVKFDDVEVIYRDRFAHPGDFVFFFVGDFDNQEMLQLCEQYIGGISGVAVKEKPIDDGVRRPDTDIVKHIGFNYETPKCMNFVEYVWTVPEIKSADVFLMDIASSVLSNRYFERMREQEGGTYGASANSGLNNFPTKNLIFDVTFDSNPEKSQKLLEIVHEEINDIIQNGADQENFSKAKEAMLKQRAQYLENNQYVLQHLQGAYVNGINRLLPKNYEQIVEKLTLKKFNKSITKRLNAGTMHKYELVMEPKK